MTRSPFDPLADLYDAARPDYPDGLYDALDRLAGPLAGSRVVDVGAGTGISTRGLLGRGARVTAVDLGAGMLTRLRSRTPSAGAAVGVGESLPLRGGVADLVTYAQAWHWVDVPVATAEVRRVLRPGGALAVWWNDVDGAALPWWRDQQSRIEAGLPGWSRTYRSRDWAAELTATGLAEVTGTVTMRWERALPLPVYETWLRSKSYVADLGAGVEDFLAAERASLRAVFGDGPVVEPFRTVLVVARCH